MKFLKNLTMLAILSVMLIACGSGSSSSGGGDENANPADYNATGTWNMTISDEQITDNPYGYCTATDIGKKLVMQLKQSESNSFTATLSDNGDALNMEGTVSNSTYNFSLKSTNGYLDAEGSFSLSSKTAFEGTVLYKYYENDQYLCSGKELFSGVMTSTPVENNSDSNASEVAPTSISDMAGTWSTSQNKSFTINSSGQISDLIITTTNKGWCFPSSPNFDAGFSDIQIQDDYSYAGTWSSGTNSYGHPYKYANVSGQFISTSSITIDYKSGNKAVGFCGDTGSESITATKTSSDIPA